MITVHHLNTSRSTRILWMLEELGLPYTIEQHWRDETTRLAPPSLKAVHPLGKAPVIVDDAEGPTKGMPIAESGAILEYLVDRYGAGRFKPAAGTREAIHYSHFMHYAEGSAMLPVMLRMYLSFLGQGSAPLMPRVESEIDNHFGYLDQHLSTHAYLCGDAFTAADVNLGYIVEAAAQAIRLERFAHLSAWFEKLQARPAYKAAIEKGGPVPMRR